MIDIKPEDCKEMWVWDGKSTLDKKKRLVIGRLDDKYMAVKQGDEEKFWAGQPFEVYLWNYAEPIKKELTAIVKSAEEITGIKGMVKFIIKLEDGKEYIYGEGMNSFAGKRIYLENDNGYSEYDYLSYDGLTKYYWLKDWLKDFREEDE